MFEVFRVFLKLGLTSFGGPIAHLSYFYDEFVSRRKWLDERAYADLVALCQFLPGPGTSQIGIAVGLSRAGWMGALAAWAGFTLPSALLLVLFGLGISHLGGFESGLGFQVLHGLKVAAVAIVAQALWGMGLKLCVDRSRATIAVFSAALVLLLPSGPWVQIFAIAAGGGMGFLFLRSQQAHPYVPFKSALSRKAGFLCFSLFLMLLLVTPVLSRASRDPALAFFESFFRVGSLVFGGGHVVLPLLQSEVVPKGWVSNELFMAGYGFAQAIPGPLFAFSAYLGAVSKVGPGGWIGAGICLVATFLPSFLLIGAVLPFWDRMRQRAWIRYAMHGINAAVVGLLLAAFYKPVWTSGILSASDFALALVVFLLLVFWKLPSWAAVMLAAGVSPLLAGGA